MTTNELVRPALKALIDMATGRLVLIAETVTSSDKPVPPKVAKHARECKALVALIIQEINNIREADKTPVSKKGK